MDRHSPVLMLTMPTVGVPLRPGCPNTKSKLKAADRLTCRFTDYSRCIQGRLPAKPRLTLSEEGEQGKRRARGEIGHSLAAAFTAGWSPCCPRGLLPDILTGL